MVTMATGNSLIQVKTKVCKASIPRTVYLTVSLLNAHFLSQSIAIINILLSQFRNGFHGNIYIHISTIGAMYTASTPHNSYTIIY